MERRRRERVKTSSWVLAMVLAMVVAPLRAQDEEQTSTSEDQIEELVVSARATLAVDHLASLSATVVDADTIRSVQAVHPHEIMNRVPGIWISRGSGQEHLTAMRSGVLTGAGACGAYRLLENGVPIRPASFCNVNGLFELNTEQALALEVIRGPASSRYGGNALHGAINAITIGERERNVGLQLGSNDYRRFDARVGNEFANAAIHATSTNGWRDDTGFERMKVSADIDSKIGAWEVAHTFAAATLDQDTGGYIVGLDAYKDDAVRFTNPNPEAFRDAYAVRYASHWRYGKFVITPYMRVSGMDFLMHFLPGDPLEKNGQRSGGISLHWERILDRMTFAIGMQSEWVSAELREVQDGPTLGSAFLVETRPTGTHYDFAVAASHIGVFHDGRLQIDDETALKYRFRVETARYDYDNLHLDGNTRDDGSACGFGGCLYTRPADREDEFTDRSMQLGFESAVSGQLMLHGSLGTGFRPPQIAELYRLQSGQAFADIDSERVDAIELGLNWQASRGSLQLAAYRERSRNLVIRDSEGFNRSDGRVNSSGLELQLAINVGANHEIHATQSLARHRYAFTEHLARREVIVAGNEVDTAPSHLGTVVWQWQARPDMRSSLELTRIGAYFMDAANTLEYPGHSVVHWHGLWRVNEAWDMRAHVRNLLDCRYADRADWSFGNPRYFPAEPRNVQVGLTRRL